MGEKTSITYAEWKAERKRLDNLPVIPGGLTQKEWDQRFNLQLQRYYLDGRTRSKAYDYALETTVRKHGHRPEGPPSAIGLALRVFWLTKVKHMDFKKVLFGALAAFLGGAGAAFGVAIEGGITSQEWGLIVGAGLAAVGLFLKEPNKSGFAHPTKKQ